MIDHRVSTKRLDRSIKKAEADRHRANARIFRCVDIEMRIANKR